MSGSPPLRFLAIVLGGWAVLRTALVAPPWAAQPAGAIAVAVASPAYAAPRPEREAGPVQPERAVAGEGRNFAASAGTAHSRQGRPRPIPAAPFLAPAPAMSVPRAPVAAAAASPVRRSTPVLATSLGPAAASTRRWSISAWAFVRRGTSAPLAAGGLLGGSQTGARLAYRLNRDPVRPLALSVRLSAPLQRASGAEAALGVDWKPVRRLPVHLLAERRQALGREGRSAFAVTLYGGVSDSPAGPFRIDAYAQAGIVGARSRDGFADGSLRISVPLGGRVRLGAGAWAAAQPGLARLDLGPQAALRLPVAGRSVTLAADWRVRVAGNAEPGSGPTLTVATDF